MWNCQQLSPTFMHLRSLAQGGAIKSKIQPELTLSLPDPAQSCWVWVLACSSGVGVVGCGAWTPNKCKVCSPAVISFSVYVYAHTHAVYIQWMCVYMFSLVYSSCKLSTEPHSFMCVWKHIRVGVCVHVSATMINDPQPCFLQLPSSPAVSHTSSRVTLMDAGRAAAAAPARPRGCEQTITSSTCKYAHTFTLKAPLKEFACQ